MSDVNKLSYDNNWAAFKLSLGVELNNGIDADNYPVVDGSVSPFFNMPVSDVSPGFKLRLKYVPFQWSHKNMTVNAGFEGTYGVSSTEYPGNEEMGSSKTGMLNSGGVGAVVGMEYFLDNGFSFGADLSVGWRGFFSEQNLSLGGYGDKKLNINSAYIGLQGGIGYEGVRFVAGVDLLIKPYKEFDGVTEADVTRYRVGVSSKGEVGALVFLGIEVSLPGFGVGSRYSSKERANIESERAKSNLEDAKTKLENAKLDLEDAKDDLDVAEDEYSAAAEADKAAMKKKVDAAKGKVSKAKKAVRDAKRDVKSAEAKIK